MAQTDKTLAKLQNITFTGIFEHFPVQLHTVFPLEWYNGVFPFLQKEHFMALEH